MRKKKIFITGTDTEVGKTYCTVRLLESLAQNHFTTTAIKPVAAGCEKNDEYPHLVNTDALALQKACTESLSYSAVNPVALQAACSPHIAAERETYALTVESLLDLTRPSLAIPSDYCLVEGAGGWFCPINNSETLADFAVALGYPVILIVGMRLGCLNHAMLTTQAIRDSGLKFHGWIANMIEPEMPYLDENIAYLQQRVPNFISRMNYKGFFEKEIIGLL